MEKTRKYDLSWKERKILKELDVDARQSASIIGKKLRMSKQVVSYHIKNMVRKGFIKEFITYIDTNKLGYTFYNIVIKLKYNTKEDRKNIVLKLKSISNVVWVSSLIGEWQMIVSILAKDSREFSMYLEKVLNSLKGKMLDYNFFIVISASQLGYKKIHSKKRENNNIKLSKISGDNLINLSDNDLNVLRFLANDARLSIVDIAKKTKLTIEKVRYSLKKLDREKVIQGYKPLMDISRSNYLWHIMFLRLKSSSEEEKEEMIDFLKDFHEVFYIVRGVGNCNLMVEFQTNTLDEFEEAKDRMSKKFSRMIADEKTVQLTEEHKCTYFPGSLGK